MVVFTPFSRHINCCCCDPGIDICHFYHSRFEWPYNKCYFFSRYCLCCGYGSRCRHSGIREYCSFTRARPRINESCKAWDQSGMGRFAGIYCNNGCYLFAGSFLKRRSRAVICGFSANYCYCRHFFTYYCSARVADSSGEVVAKRTNERPTSPLVERYV